MLFGSGVQSPEYLAESKYDICSSRVLEFFKVNIKDVDFEGHSETY